MLVEGNKISAYRQIANAVKQRVRSGTYRSGAMLPSVRQLSREFKVSTFSVHRAIRELRETGVVTTHHGKGTMVMAEEPCKRAAIGFGFIEPYKTGMLFENSVLRYAQDAFGKQDNFLVTRSSQEDPALERQIAEHFIHNGIQGILLWPVPNDPNGKFFEDLSRKTPVVVVDRQLNGTGIPAVVQDYYQVGCDIIACVFEVCSRKRLLAVIDNLAIPSYGDLMRGLQDQAKQMGRSMDLTIVHLPVSELLLDVYRGDYSPVDRWASYLGQMVAQGGYDVLFSSQDDFLDFVAVESGLLDQAKGLQLAAVGNAGFNMRSRHYNAHNVLEWGLRVNDEVTEGAELLQRWVLTGRRPSGTVKIKMERSRFPKGKEKEQDKTSKGKLVDDGGRSECGLSRER